MPFLTTAFYLVSGGLCVGASIFTFYYALKIKRWENIYLAFVFFWLGAHAYAYVYPSIVDPGNLSLLAKGYIVGDTMVFLVFLFGLGVQYFMTKHIINKKVIALATIILIIDAVVTIGLLIYDFRLPIITETGLVFWNVNHFSQWLFGITSLIYGAVWTYVFYKGAMVVEDPYARFKLITIGTGGVMIGIVALLVHTSSNEFQTIAGHTLFVVSGLIIMSIYIVPKKVFK